MVNELIRCKLRSLIQIGKRVCVEVWNRTINKHLGLDFCGKGKAGVCVYIYILAWKLLFQNFVDLMLANVCLVVWLR